MKSFLLLITLILNINIAVADEDTNKEEALRPYQVCRRINTSSYYSDCIEIVIKVSYKADVKALEMCDMLFSEKSVVKCLEEINGVVYDQIALGLCDSYSDAKNTYKCLKTIGGYTFEPYMIELCQHNEPLGVISCLKQLRIETDSSEPGQMKPTCVKYRNTNKCLKR